MRQIDFKKQQKEFDRVEDAKHHKTNFGPEESAEIHSLLIDLEKQKKEQNKQYLLESMKVKKDA